MKTTESAKLLGYTTTRLIKIVQSNNCPLGLTPDNKHLAPSHWVFNADSVKGYKEWSEKRTGQAVVLSPEELNDFLNWQFNNARLPQRQIGAVIALSHYAGLRISEIATLQVKDIADSRGRIVRNKLISGFNTKTNKARTVFFGHARLQDILAAHLRQNCLSDPEELLFQTSRGKPFTGRYLSTRYKEAFARYGRPDISSHSGRRYFITEMLSNGVPLKVAQKMAGHSNPMTTALYHEPTEQDFEDALAKIK